MVVPLVVRLGSGAARPHLGSRESGVLRLLGATRLPAALHRQATVTEDEAESILVEHIRLDGWLNYAYRALKNDRDERFFERRLDAAESVPWLLDVIFTLAGRVRPYHKYLPWELRRHPLADWDADELLGLLSATLDGDPAAIRPTFQPIEPLCEAFRGLGGRADGAEASGLTGSPGPRACRLFR